jgi:hypothetical protein
MPVLTRSADRFQRALEGERLTDERLAELVATSRHLVDLGADVPAPEAAFRLSLRERLMDEAARLPSASPAGAKATAARPAATRTGPMVLVVGRGLPRLVAGAAASALLVGGIVGAVSRTAVPGDALYPVKGWIDGVAVRLADSDLDRGQTYLSQAQEHISDARELARREPADAGDVNVALQAAIESVQKGQRALDSSYTATNDPQALLALRDFTARVLPQLEAMRSEVPAPSLPWLGRLEALLHQTDQAIGRRIAACGSRCGGGLSTTFGPTSLPTTAAAPTTGAPSTAGTTSAGASGGVTVPTTAVTDGASGATVPAQGVTTGTSQAPVGVGTGSATLSTGGATVGLPSATLSVPIVPSATATVGLPSATLGTGGVSATLPRSTRGPVTLPGPTLELP